MQRLEQPQAQSATQSKKSQFARTGTGSAVADSIEFRFRGRNPEKTSERYAHGIRATPTTIVNNRMIIGTLPYEQLRAILQALVERSGGQKKFIENREPTKP